MTSISRKLVDDIEKIRLRKTELRGLIRNNLSLLNIMTEDLTVYVSRLPRNRSNQVTTHIKWFLINVKELTERIEVSFSFESEDTKEKRKIVRQIARQIFIQINNAKLFQLFQGTDTVDTDDIPHILLYLV